jgi:hypothetical protein
MNYNLDLHDRLCKEHHQTLEREAAQRRLLASLPRRHSIARRAIGKFGVALVAVGSKLEQIDHRREPVGPGVLKYESQAR